MKVKEIMNTNVVRVSCTSSIREVSQSMHKFNIGRVPVVAPDGSVIGIVTDRDIVVSAIAKEDEYLDNRIDTIMTRVIIYISPESDVLEALELMGKHRIRSILVLSAGILAGIVTLGDIVQTFKFGDEVIKTLNHIYSEK